MTDESESQWQCIEHGTEYVEGCAGCETSVDFNDDDAPESIPPKVDDDGE